MFTDDFSDSTRKMSLQEYYNSIERENKLLFPDVDWDGIADEFSNFSISRSTPLTAMADANLIAPWILRRFDNLNNLGFTTAVSLLLGTPLSHLIAAHDPRSTGAMLIGMVPDPFKCMKLSPLDRAHLNFVRAAVGLALFG